MYDRRIKPRGSPRVALAPGDLLLCYTDGVTEAMNPQQEMFARQLIASQERERGRIAAELHDGLSQSLVIIKNRAMLSLIQPDDHDRAIEQLREIADASTHAIDEVKDIVYDLHPIQLDRLGLTRALPRRCRVQRTDNHRDGGPRRGRCALHAARRPRAGRSSTGPDVRSTTKRAIAVTFSKAITDPYLTIRAR